MRGFGVAGQALHVREGHALLEEVRNLRDPEGMRRESGGEARRFHAPLQHAADVLRCHLMLGEARVS